MPQFANQLFICSDLKDAIAWLDYHHFRYRDLDLLAFFVIGNAPEKHHAEFIQQNAPNQKLHFLFSKDDTGALCDLKLACYIRNKPIKITYNNHQFEIFFENKSCQSTHLSLNALEKASGYNFKIRTHKPKNASTFYEQFRNRHHP